MTAPANTPIPRPDTVPADARWDGAVGVEWQTGPVDSDGKKHGSFRGWSRAGVLHSETPYDHGVLHGKQRRFHPDGSIALVSEWARGVELDTIYYRNDTSHPASPEPFPECAPAVRSAGFYTRDGRANYTIRYFLRDGTEAGPDGQPVPPRPPSVPASARWLPDLRAWVDGELERGTNRRLGVWRRWSRTGTFERDERYDAGRLISASERGDGGAVSFEAVREGDAMQCTLFAGGTRVATGAIADGLVTGTWRLFGEPDREIDATPHRIAHDITGVRLERALAELAYRADEPMLALPTEFIGIDTEPWHVTTGAQDRRVAEIPRLVRALVALDVRVRDYALAAIEAELDRHGEVFPATALAIPYFGKLLAHPNADTSALVRVIHVASDATTTAAESAPVHAAVSAAIAVAWPAIWARFASAGAEDRHRILGIARAAPNARADVLALATRDPDPVMRAFAMASITDGDYQLAEVKPCLDDRDPLVRAATAIAIGCSAGPESPREVVTQLADAIRRHKELAPRFAALTWAEEHVLAQLAFAAGAIGTPDARSLVHSLCAVFGEVDGRSAITFATGLLALAFGTGERPFAKRFVEVLQTLATGPGFWVYDSDASELLGRWNLPTERKQLGAFVTQLGAARDPESIAYAKMHSQ